VHFFLGHYFQLLISVYCANTASCTMLLCIALRHIRFLSPKKEADRIGGGFLSDEVIRKISLLVNQLSKLKVWLWRIVVSGSNMSVCVRFRNFIF
jgi:hypothetical protein